MACPEKLTADDKNKIAYVIADDVVTENWYKTVGDRWIYFRALNLKPYNCLGEELPFFKGMPQYGISAPPVYGLPGQTVFGGVAIFARFSGETMGEAKGTWSSDVATDAVVLKAAAKAGLKPGAISNYELVTADYADPALTAWATDAGIGSYAQKGIQKISLAMECQKTIQFFYGPRLRFVEPYELGLTSSGEMLFRGYQIKGYSLRGKTLGWKLFKYSLMSDIQVQCIKYRIRSDYYTLPPFWTKDVVTWVP